MRRFLIGWILIVLLLPFAAAWIYSEWSEKKQQIEQDEYSAAVLSRHIREPPYVSDSDRAARAHQ